MGCGEPGAPLVLPLGVHTLPNCSLPPRLARGNLQLLALGDFAASNDSAEILPLERRGAALKFPLATRAVEARADDGVTAFAGYGERRQNAGLDVLLWPEQATCVVWQPDGSRGYPGQHGGQALGYSAGVVLAAGGNDPLLSDAIVGALSFDVATGAVRALDASDEGGLSEPRAFATVTRFGDQLLVAGGEQPVFGVPDDDIEPNASAEIFDPRLGRFSGEQIELRSTRTHHTAVTLDDGRTLLIGGRTKVGATSIAQYQLEIVDPGRKRASVGDAIAPRIDPRALHLSDGRVFVGGGVGLDGALTDPVGQWLTPDAHLDTTQLSLDVAPRFERAFVAMPGGGVLAVGGCEDRPATSAEDATACAANCRHGCVPLDGGFDAWWIDRDGAAARVELDGIAAPRPILLQGSDGRPWLVAAAADAPQIPQLYRFNPWAAQPSFEPAPWLSGVRLPTPDMPAPLSLEPDAFVWLDDGDEHGQLLGLRLGTRNRYAQDLSLVLSADAFAPELPRHLVPDRVPGNAVSYDGTLTLSDPGVTVMIADADYADVTLQLRLRGKDLPVVVLGKTLLGAAACPWPDGGRTGGDADLPTILRHDGQAELRFHGGEQACTVEPGRLQLAVRAGDHPSTITELDVQRGLPAP